MPASLSNVCAHLAPSPNAWATRVACSWLGLLALGLGLTAGCNGGSSVPACMNPTPAEGACNDCASASCSSAVDAVTTYCSAYAFCYEQCDCSDASCIARCEAGNLVPACIAAGKSLASCIANQCPRSECAGAASPDAG